MSGYLDPPLRRRPPRRARAGARLRRALAAGADVAVIAEIKRARRPQGGDRPRRRRRGDRRAPTRRAAPRACRCSCAERDFGGQPVDLAAVPGPRTAVPALAKDFTVFPEQVARAAAGRRGRGPGHPGARHRRRGARGSCETAGLLGDGRAGRGAHRRRGRAGARRSRPRSWASTRATWIRSRSIATASWRCSRRCRRRPVRVAESGIAARADVEAARDAGADAVLVGTSLMRDPALLADLMGVPRLTRWSRSAA